MKKLFVYGGVFLLLMHHFFIWTLVFADEYSGDHTILSMEIVEEAIQESNQTIKPEEPEEGILNEEFVIDDDLGDREDLAEETENNILYITQEFSSEEISFPQILITEVAFAGSQEWFELYNPYDINFVGTIDITGVRSSILTLQNITIPAKTAIVIARSQGLEIIADTGVVHSIQTLSIPDTTPLHITLSISGEVVDIFSASTSLMNQANKSTNDRSSLQRTLDDISVVRLSPPSQNYNTTDPVKYKINPGIVYQSLSDTPPAACEKYGQIVQIREIFRGTADRETYIELFIPGHMTQELTIVGTVLDQSFTVPIDQSAGHYHLVSIPGNSYTQQPFVSDNQKLSFRSGLGNLYIYGQDGQVLDKVDITVRETGYSSYVSGQGCQRAANQVDVYSPGFSRSYLNYFPEGVEKVVPVIETITIPAEPTQCEYNQDNADTTIQIPTIPRTGVPITITHVNYQGPTTGKSITLFMTGSDPIALSDFYILTNGTNKRNLREILQPDIPLTLTGSLGFAATQARCIQLFHKDYPNVPIATYCYDPLEDAKRKGEIKITNIVYETPAGSTTRKLHLHVPEGVVDLSKNRYIMINTTKRNLTSYGLISGHVVLEGTFPFPKTTTTCVDLRQYDVLFDRYCYTPPQSIQSTNQQTTPFDPQRLTYPIKITHVHYAGPTTGKSITLFMTGGSPVDLSHFHILTNNTTKRNLKGILEPNTPLTITGSLGFAATQARCVQLFHKEHLFDTYCYDPAEDKAKEQATRVWTGEIVIDYVRYQTDENHPDQSITLVTTGADIIFAYGRYLMINARKFNLSSFGTGSGDITLTGNFRFPKTIASCVTIGQYDREFTTYCYDPKAKKETEQKEVYSGVHLEILATLPNPRGADAGKERIDILLHTPDTVDLSQGFSILINGRTKRAISGEPVAGEVYRLTGTFVLPNAASCFSILYHDDVLDTFCYPQTKEGIMYDKNAQTLLALTDAELGLLNATTLKRFDNRLCLTLSDVIIKCRTVPAGKLAARQMEELKLSRNYITTLHDYLYNHRQIIYFNTDIIHYKTIFDQSKKDISNYQFTRPYGSERIPISDIQTRFQLQYQQPLLQTVKSQIGSSLFGPKLAQNYQKAKEKWYKNK